MPFDRLKESGETRLAASFHWSESTVTVSAMMDAAECGVWVGGEAFAVDQNGSAELVLKSPST